MSRPEASSSNSPIGEYVPPAFNEEKLKAAVHYICHKAGDPSKLGATKLNKILFYSDMQAYLDRQRPITGEQYVKRPFGPMAAHIDEVLQDLKDQHALAISEASGMSVYTGEPYTQRRFVALTPPNPSTFDGLEVKILDHMVSVICNKHTARSISAASHDIVYDLMEPGEVIPYYAVYSHLLAPVDEETRQWALGRIASAQGAAA